MFMRLGNNGGVLSVYSSSVCVCEKGQCVPEGIPAVTHPGLKQK